MYDHGQAIYASKRNHVDRWESVVKRIKSVLCITALAVFLLAIWVDFPALSHWWANRVSLPFEPMIASVDKNQPWQVVVPVRRFLPSGDWEKLDLPKDQYTVTIKPLDDETEKHAVLTKNTVGCAKVAILHFEIQVDLVDGSDFKFMDDSTSRGFQQVLIVGIDTDQDWLPVDLESESESVRRHLSVIGRIKTRGEFSEPYLPWRPHQVLSTENFTLLNDVSVSVWRSQARLSGSCYIFEGDQQEELPRPPKMRGEPRMSIFQNRWILAGGVKLGPKPDSSIPVMALDLQTKEWELLPTLPNEADYVVAVNSQQNELTIYAMLKTGQTKSGNTLATYVFRNDSWSKQQESNFVDRADQYIPVETGILSVATTSGSAPLVKHLESGWLRTLTIGRRGSMSPITTADGRVFQWTQGRVYELDPQLFLDIE